MVNDASSLETATGEMAQKWSLLCESKGYQGTYSLSVMG